MSYRKRTVKRGGGTGSPQEWRPSSRGEGKHAFVDPTPVGLGAKRTTQNPQPQRPAEKKTNRPPTTTQPVEQPKKKQVTETANREVDPTQVVGGRLGRLLLGTPFQSTLYKINKRAERQGLSFDSKRFGHLISYASADGLANTLPRSMVYAPGFLARKLDELYDGGFVDKERTQQQIDLDLTENEGRIRLQTASLTTGGTKYYVEADLSEVVSSLADEQAAVRQGLRLRAQDFYPHIRIGFLEGGEGPVYREVVGEVENALNIGQLSLGPLSVFPKDL